VNDDKLTKEIIAALSQYLLANMASVTDSSQIREEWPESNEELGDYPAISIMTAGSPEYIPHMGPVEDSGVVNGADPNQYDYKYSLGQYDFTLQVDIWTDYKEKRHQVYQEFWAAFHKQFVSQGYGGLTLTLSNYHNAPVHFSMTGYNYGDSEEASQRKEWRVKIGVIANCEAILETTQPAMIDNQAVTQIDDQTKIE